MKRNSGKWTKRAAIACAALLLAAPCAQVAAPQTAEAGGDLFGALIGGGIQYVQLKKEIDYIDGTEKGRNEYFAEMKKQYGVNTDWALNQQLKRIMTNLTNAIASVDPSINEKPYQYFINKDKSFNAFCSLGHDMSINTGMFTLVDNDDEIAVVLGHEMGHGQKGHPAKGAKRSLGPAVLASATGNMLGNIAASLWNNQGITKPMEWEADNLAFDYITHSDYNPGATAAIWQRVIDKYGDQAIFNSDHPSNSARRDNYEKKLYEYSGKHVHASNGTVTVNGKTFCKPAATSSMSAKERAYFVQGNLAAAYKNGQNKSDATVSGSTVMLGDQPILTCTANDESAETLANRLNQLK